ncbi:MAG TPA: ATP-binding protein [Myxococcaceae bacterium]
MTMRSKVLLFAAVAIGLMAAMGGAFFQGAMRGQSLRLRLTSVHRQIGLYGALNALVWSSLEQLMRAQREGRDVGPVLREHERRMEEHLASLKQGMRDEQTWDDVTRDPAEAQHLEAFHQAHRQWSQGLAEAVRQGAEAPLTPERWWQLVGAYDRDVKPHGERAWTCKQQTLRQLRAHLDDTFQQQLRIAIAVPLSCIVLVALLAAIILVPLRRELRELRRGAERIGEGDFGVELPARRNDELGTLAQAFNRMARELQETLREKQRLMAAEAEAAEREFRRYNALLEQTVQTRTAELEAANTRLADSLKQLQSTQAQLLFADRLASMGRLAAGVGHEINNPLAYVVSNLNYIFKELNRTQAAPSPEERHELLTAVADAKEGAERVRVIVQDLKTLSRPDDASNGPVDLRAVVRGAVKIASHELRRRARVVEELQEVPPVLGHAARLGQVFLNLLINAAQSIPEGNVEAHEIRVVARKGASGRAVEVEVRDTGCGIEPEHLERIFDPFFTTKPVGEGTGLGLSVCHGILSAMGAKIRVESQVGRGTAFYLELPVAREGLKLPGSASVQGTEISSTSKTRTELAGMEPRGEPP